MAMAQEQIVKGPHRSPAIRRAVDHARRLGFTVVFRPFVEDARTPGLLGQMAGRCDMQRREIVVGTHGRGRSELAAIIEHELEHAAGKERGADRPEFGLRCGGML
jgi:hypothetical protein